MFIQIDTVHSCFLTKEELRGCNRKYLAHKPKIFTNWPLKRKFAHPWLRIRNEVLQ